jgi:hypothetical protein
VDVTGIEPVTPCLQNSPTSSCNPCQFNQSKENPKLNSSSGVWLYVRECISLHVGSLQKSLQSLILLTERGITSGWRVIQSKSGPRVSTLTSIHTTSFQPQLEQCQIGITQTVLTADRSCS